MLKSDFDAHAALMARADLARRCGTYDEPDSDDPIGCLRGYWYALLLAAGIAALFSALTM
jgi:hypothetical protein